MTATPAPAPQRKSAVILFADVHGYSRLMAVDEEATMRRVQQGIDLFRRLIGDYGGRVVETAGDGVFAVFGSAPAAVRFAIEIQREFRNAAVWGAGEMPLQFRIGIHAGEVVFVDNQVRGHHVNLTARIQERAVPGGVCVSEVVYRALPGEYAGLARSLGRPNLKNLGCLVEIFEIGAAQERPPLLAPGLVEEPPLAPRIDHEIAVAVLPLTNLLRDPADDHLCDGLTVDLITNLTRFRELWVIARHSSFLFRHTDLPPDELGQRLGVRYLVVGGLQRSGTRLRLRVQLLEAASGRVLWAEHYNGDLADLFAFQDDVTATVTARLAVQISAAERRRLEAQHVPDLRAYGLILRGVDLSFRFRKEANLHARRLFEEAAAIDPAYGRCYAGMSRTFNLAWRYRWSEEPESCLDRAVELAHAAIEHDSLDARGFSELGYALLYKKQHGSSIAAYERAIELNPNDADVLAEMGDALVYDGQAQRALDYLQRAMRLNPYHPDWYLWLLADAHFTLGDYEATIRTLRRMRDQSEAHRMLAASYAHLNELDEARKEARLVLAAHPHFSVAHWRNVPPYKDKEALERLVEGLKKAGLP